MSQRREIVSPWLGGRWFRIAAALALIVVVLYAFIQHRRIEALRVTLNPAVALIGSRQPSADGPDSYRALVYNLRDGTPIRDANVRLSCATWVYDAERDDYELITRSLGEALTDASGRAAFAIDLPKACTPAPTPSPSRYNEPSRAVVNARVETHGMTIEREVYLESYRELESLIATDKPIYQPGQTIRMRALSLASRKPAANAEVTLEVRDARRNRVFKRVLRASDFGIVHADFELADQVNIGTYTIRAAREGSSAEHTVDVRRYSLPKFELSLSVDRAVAAPESSIRATVDATWMFGKPVAGAEVAAWLAPKGSQEPPERLDTVKTDENGRAVIELPVGSDERSFDLVARVRTEGGDERTATKDIVVSKRGVIAELVPDGGPLLGGVENDAFVLASSADGRPLRTRVRVDPGGSEVEASDSGVARLRFIPIPGQSLVVSSLDGSEERYPLPPLAEDPDAAVLIRSDRSTYESGETVRIGALTTGQEGQFVDFDLSKGGRVLATTSCRLTRGRCEASIQVPRHASGLMQLRALHPTTSSVGFSNRFILVNDASGLTVKVRADRDVYAPAGTAQLAFDVARVDGTPTAAALSLAGVDEAVFALADARPDLQMFFFGIGRDLTDAANIGTAGRWRGRRPPLSSDAPLLRGRTEELLTGDSPPEVRGAMLAALASAAPKPEHAVAGGLWESEGDWGWNRQQRRAWGWVAIMPGLLFLVSAAVLVASGVRRARVGKVRQLLLDTDVAEWKQSSFGLLVWWAASFFAPVLTLATSVYLLDEVFRVRGDAFEGLVFGIAVFSLAFPLVMLVRALLRSIKTKVAWAMGDLAQVGWLLPASVPLFHGQLVILAFWERELLRPVVSEGGIFLGLIAMVIEAQLVFGALSVIRNTPAEETSKQRRTWLFLGRASFVGLPVAIALFFYVAYEWNRRAADDYYLETEQYAASSADNKEGGTGLRAKGEEGSMGMVSKPAGTPSLAKPSRIRTHFPETLLWAPELRTDDAGHARISVPLADSITTWRLSASAISGDGAHGATTAPLRVMQDFFGDMSLPAVLTQKDETSIPVTVFNYLDETQTVRAGLELDEGIEALDGRERLIEVEPRQSRGLSFRVRAVFPGTHKVRLTLAGSRLADALERTVRVEPDGMRIEQVFNGVLPSTPKHRVEIPEEAIPGGSDLYVKIYGGMVSRMAEGLDGAFKQPYGCFEQTSSATYPNVLVLDYLRRKNRAEGEVEKKALGYIATGLQRLVSYEVDGGGFSLYGDAPANVVLTAYGLMEFHDMAKVYDVDPELLARTRDWLLGKQGPSGLWSEAVPPYYPDPEFSARESLRTSSYIALAIAETGEKDSRLDRALDRIEGGDSPDADESYLLALRANALAAGGRADKAKKLIEKLVPRGVRDTDGLHWSSRGSGIMYGSGRGLEVELTGMIVQAMARVGGWETERSAALAWIAAQRNDKGTWYSTQATVAAMRAMLTSAKPEASGTQVVQVLVNGSPAGEVTIPEAERDVHKLLSLREQLRPGGNEVELRTANQEALFQVVAVHHLPWDRAPAGDTAPIELSIRTDRNKVRVGEVVSCTATLTSRRPEPVIMPMMELGVPPGFSVEPQDFEELVRKGTIQRYELTAGRVVVYLAGLSEKEPLSFVYRLRAVSPVRAAVPPSVAYPYYESEVRVETKPFVLTAE